LIIGHQNFVAYPYIMDHRLIYCRQLEDIEYDPISLRDEVEQHFKDVDYLHHVSGRGHWLGISLLNSTGKHDKASLNLRLHKNVVAEKEIMMVGIKTSMMDGLKVIPNILEQMPGRVLLARIMKIKSGRGLIPHRDGDCFDLEKGNACRFHIPIITDNSVLFCCSDLALGFHLEVGKVYYVNVSQEHWVINPSQITDRLHLIVDIEKNDEVVKMLYKANRHPDGVPVEVLKPEVVKRLVMRNRWPKRK